MGEGNIMVKATLEITSDDRFLGRYMNGRVAKRRLRKPGTIITCGFSL